MKVNLQKFSEKIAWENGKYFKNYKTSKNHFKKTNQPKPMKLGIPINKTFLYHSA